MENFSDRGIKKSVDWALVVTYLLLILILRDLPEESFLCTER